MDKLKGHLPFQTEEGLHELKKVVGRFEERIYTSATSQSDYLQKISLKMLSMELKSQNAMPSGAGGSSKPPDPGSDIEEHFAFMRSSFKASLSV